MKLSKWAHMLITFFKIKCELILITNKKRPQTNIHVQITFKIILLDEVSEHTSLGLTISNQMSWASHISKNFPRKQI